MMPITWAGLVILAIGIIGITGWWLIDKTAGRAFEAELERYWRNAESNVITALRRDLYERAGLAPMMSPPQPRGSGVDHGVPRVGHRQPVHLPSTGH
jgi:hypothetical protein